MPKRQPAVRVKIPTLLADSVKNKRAILFLGAGASKEAKNAANQTPPDADQLRDILAERFFGQPMKTRDVMAVAEMAITSSGGAPLVFNEVRQAFEGFRPSKAHKLISAFNWRAIATTNYDLLVEKAYSDSAQRLQTLVPFVKDDQPIEERLQAVIYPVPYLKLHGCLDHILDPDIPLILSRETYASYSNNRTRLFDRLKDYARESAVIFVGYRLDDPHIRDLASGSEISRGARLNLGLVRSRLAAGGSRIRTVGSVRDYRLELSYSTGSASGMTKARCCAMIGAVPISRRPRHFASGHIDQHQRTDHHDHEQIEVLDIGYGGSGGFQRVPRRLGPKLGPLSICDLADDAGVARRLSEHSVRRWPD